MPDAEAPAEEAPPEGDAPAAEGAASGHQVRFVARTLDGMEVISAPIALAAGPGSAVQAKVSLAYWGHGSYLAGQTAYACAAAHGAEGASIKFFIEQQSGGAWSQAAELEARVKDETAVAEWPVPADAAKGAKVRFRAETPWSKKTALAFSVTTLAAPAADGGKAAPAAEGGEAAPAAAKPAPRAAKPAPAAAKQAPTAAKPTPKAAPGGRSMRG